MFLTVKTLRKKIYSSYNAITRPCSNITLKSKATGDLFSVARLILGRIPCINFKPSNEHINMALLRLDMKTEDKKKINQKPKK